MKTSITCYISKEDKDLVDAEAKKERMSTSVYCRVSILKKILKKEEKEDAEI